MRKVFVESNNVISPLGFCTKENFENISIGKSGIKACSNTNLSAKTFPASYINNTDIDSEFKMYGDANNYTRFEKLSIISIKKTIEESSLSLDASRTLLIFSTTKGNIELLDNELRGNFSEERVNLHTTAKIISSFFNFNTEPLVVSNACVSGIAAIVLAQRLIKQGLYDNIIVNGTDVLSKFVVSGFQSFLSLSENPCKPFDISRDGLTLGEASATLILTNKETNIEVVNGATSNDANHISGPSRTGEGLFIAINKTIENNKNIDFISAHGTATPYNDDMESKAIFRNGLDSVPTNSLKGYFGHTLGAAGVIESVLSIESLKQNILINTLGCNEVGVAEKINVITQTKAQQLKSVLKLASGFGGGNAAVLFRKHE